VLGRQFNLPARELMTAYNTLNRDWSAVENHYVAKPPVPVLFRRG
jgi:hypothetical protein